MATYYNEIDPYAAQWLRNLIVAGHIAPGDVDERDIRDVRPDDLRGYTQCHFFAGIGVWSYALRLAGWSDDRPVWTGSCPCQPFSAAGKGAGFDDERHLWPAWDHLIRECRPAAILGEQVASKDAEPWLDLVSADLEGLGYAFGALAFPSAGVGAPHIRDRTYFVADAYSERSLPGALTGIHSSEESTGPRHGKSERLGAISRLADAKSDRYERPWKFREPTGRHGLAHDGEIGATNGYWQRADWVYCRDGKFRPVEPGTFPLAHGAAARVGRLRAYGNAINAYQAAEFIRAAIETIEG